jgi:hypothetical protein
MNNPGTDTTYLGRQFIFISLAIDKCSFRVIDSVFTEHDFEATIYDLLLVQLFSAFDLTSSAMRVPAH